MGFDSYLATITTDALLKAISHRRAAPARNARSALVGQADDQQAGLTVASRSVSSRFSD